jgi:phosphopantothenoylcysteine decarboxylase/phosphopantothenate--cysteine ligase
VEQSIAMSDVEARGDILDDRGVELRSSSLTGRRVLLVVAGGIAAITTPQLCRELRRHGATVDTAMTPAAESFLGSLCLEWASGSPVLTGLTGRAEQTIAHDLVLVAPATLDLVGKLAHGIADNAALSSLASAVGRRTPVLLCPTMHESLWSNPLFQENLERLRVLGLASAVPPVMEEGKAKMPPIDSILRAVRRALTTSILRGKRILLTAGPTRAPIDDVRFIENRSSGRFGCKLAAELDARGADVTLVYGPGSAVPPVGIEVVPVETPDQMLREVLRLRRERQPVAGVFAAAVLDYVPDQPVRGKIASGGEMSVRFRPTPKIIDEAGETGKDWVKIGFKLQAGVSDTELLKHGLALLERARCRAVVCNHIEQVGARMHRGAIVTADGATWIDGRGELVDALCIGLEAFISELLP